MYEENLMYEEICSARGRNCYEATILGRIQKFFL